MTGNNTVKFTRLMSLFISLVLFLVYSLPVQAHHVLGRPAYSLSEDSNTPPGEQIEAQIGNYLVTYMIYPAFPKPNETGRINLYVMHIDRSEPFQGKINFKVRNDDWFGVKSEILGVEEANDNVYRQRFMFKDSGDYIITVELQTETGTISQDFPLRIGKSPIIGPVGTIIISIVLFLIGINVFQRKRIKRLKIQRHHSDNIV